ncbi:unnamed protein product [Zymoseptoria tritici ST99CH_1A5]|uniref:Peptidase M12A domain-containing protein n=1 Tax=Zymoseptoria tritici ST99CH_1A5 TaxID=1276529 RepID=A0A1Y6LBK0_ZYMTR|nr:unnamed protein product [Zymoseptoria tritici ST99CH_3D1]SMY21823.1 unnamed protein product [Zymoseptoria tritici ST99CH_1A5]
MEVLAIILALLGILIAPVLSCPDQYSPNYTHTEPGHHLTRRWYGVKALHPPMIAQKPYYYPWPATCGYPNALQPVRYCFLDKWSADNLEDVLNVAISYWGEAMRVSALKIILDPGARGNKHNYCGTEGVATDALVISDETKPGDDEWNGGPNCVTASTVGYKYTPRNQYPSPHRHYMKVCAYQPQYPYGTAELASRDIAHELGTDTDEYSPPHNIKRFTNSTFHFYPGHVIGLQHEHQRPDRDLYIKFNCRYLQGYDEAKYAADIDAEALFEQDADDSDDELSLSQKMALVCHDEYYAISYFPNAREYISYNPSTSLKESHQIAQNNQHSTSFDYSSIMIYDSDLCVKTRNANKNVLVRRDNGGEVWMGGGVGADPAKTKVSRGDVARVAMLYESGTEENREAQRGVGWGVATRVKVRGVEVAVREGSLRGREEL